MTKNSTNIGNPDFMVLNQLFAAQSMLHIFPNASKLCGFITKAIKTIPGVKECIFCARNCTCMPVITINEVKKIHKEIKNIPDHQDFFDFAIPKKENLHTFQLKTTERSYGYIFIITESAANFDIFQAAISNFINMVAIDLESRWQKKGLTKHQLHLNEMVDERTAELRDEMTNRKQAEEELRKSEEKYRLMATNTLDVIWSTDLDFNITFMSNAIFNLIGYTADEFVGMNASEIINPDDMTIVRKTANELISSYKSGHKLQSQFQIKHVRKNGIEVDVELTTNLLLDKTAKVIGFQGRTIDITNRLKSERIQHLLETGIEQAAEVVVITDTKGIIQYVNPAFEKISGYKRIEVIGQNPRVLKSGHHDQKFYKELWDTITAGKTWHGEFINQTKNGREYHEKASISPVKNPSGRIINFIALKENISEQKKAAEALHESKRKLIEAQELARIGDFTWNVITGKVSWSDGMYKLLKYEKNEKIDLAKVNTAIHHPHDLDRVTKWLGTCLASGEDKLTPNEYRLVCKDGVVIDVHTKGNITFKDGKAIEVFGMCQDITHRKQAEEELNKHREHLEVLVKERTAELEEKNEQLERFNKLFVGREFRIKELRDKVKELEKNKLQ